MQVNNNASNLKLAVQTEVIKKSQDVTKNEISYILQKNMENTEEIQKQAAEVTGKGINLNIQG